MRKIGLLVLLNIALIVFGFGYAHNQLIDYNEIGVADIEQYIKSFNTAKDIGVQAINKFNENWEDFVNYVKNYQDYNFSYDNNTGFINNLYTWFSKICKILATPFAIILDFILCLFNQICTAIYFAVALLLWAGGLRSVLVRCLL